MATLITPQSGFPGNNAIIQALEVAGSAEAGDYLMKQLEPLVPKKPLDEKERAEGVLDRVKNFVADVRAKRSLTTQPWSGEIGPDSLLENMLINKANEALRDLSNPLENVVLNYAIRKDGHFLRGYSDLEQNISEPKSVDALDKLFQGWLANKGYVMKDGYFYKANDESTRATPEVVKQLLADQSLEQHMNKHGIKNLTFSEQGYPGEEKTATAQIESESPSH